MAFDRALEQIKGEEGIIKAVKEQAYTEYRRTFFKRIQEIVLDNFEVNELDDIEVKKKKKESLNFYMEHPELKNEKLNECMELFLDYCKQKDGEN